MPPDPLTTTEFAKRTAIVIGLTLIPLLFWYLFDVILIVVGAILIATLLRLVAEPLASWCKLPRPTALIVSGLFLAAVVGGIGYLFGTRISSEFSDVVSRANTALTSITKSLQGSGSGRMLLSHMGGSGFSLPLFITSIFSLSARVLEAVVVTVIMGAYLAAQPKLYSEGLITLFPQRSRPYAAETLEDIAAGVRLWLIGQLIQMLLIGALSAGAVWLIGLPSPLALGAIAGIAELVPYVGPVIAAVPAILVAFTQDNHLVVWTIAAYLAIHQIEGNIVVPLVQRHMIYIPPAVMLLGIVTVVFAFGNAAVVFASPIAVIAYIAIKKIYVRDSLGEPTVLPGEQA